MAGAAKYSVKTPGPLRKAEIRETAREVATRYHHGYSTALRLKDNTFTYQTNTSRVTRTFLGSWKG